MNKPAGPPPDFKLLGSKDPSIVHLHVALDPTTMGIESNLPLELPALLVWMCLVAVSALRPEDLHAAVTDIIGALVRDGMAQGKQTQVNEVPPGTAISREAFEAARKKKAENAGKES